MTQLLALSVCNRFRHLHVHPNFRCSQQRLDLRHFRGRRRQWQRFRRRHCHSFHSRHDVSCVISCNVYVNNEKLKKKRFRDLLISSFCCDTKKYSWSLLLELELIILLVSGLWQRLNCGLIVWDHCCCCCCCCCCWCCCCWIEILSNDLIYSNL